jgi:hypothetical protein
MGLKLDIKRIYRDDQRSFLAVFTVSGGQTQDDDKIFVVNNQGMNPGPTETPGQRVGVYVLCEEVVDPEPVEDYDYFIGEDYELHPNRVLQTIASIEDMRFLPADAPTEEDKTGFYRTNTVSVMTRSLDMLNCVIDLIYADIAIHCACKESETPDLEMSVAQTCSQDDAARYFLPE